MTETQNKEYPKIDGQKSKKTGGEIALNRAAYTGIGLGVNELSSLWITDQFVHGKNLLDNSPGFLKRIGGWFSKEGFDRLSTRVAKTFHTTTARASNGILMVTLLSGGTLLLLPMKWLEDHKIYWVKKANHVLDWLRGNKLSEAESTARDKKVEQDIACSPRQSWCSMLLGRLFACMASVGTGTFLVGPKNNQRLMDFSEKLFTGSVQPEGQKNRWHRYAALASVETYSCLISSVVLELASKLFARKSMRPHDPEICRAAHAPQPAAGADNHDTGTAHADKVKAQKEWAGCVRVV